MITEINGGWITRITPDGTKTRLGTAADGPNGLALGPDSALYLCDNGGDFPRTDTEKIRKAGLRAEGNRGLTPTTWDAVGGALYDLPVA